MATPAESATYAPRSGDLIEVRRDAEYWQFDRDNNAPGTWQRTVGFDTDSGIQLMWVNAHGDEPFDRLTSGQQYVIERDTDGQTKELALVRDDSGDLRTTALDPEPEPLDLTGAEPFKLSPGDTVVTNDRGAFAYYGTDKSGAERWTMQFQGGIAAEIPDAPFKAGEPTAVVRERGGEDYEFTVAQGEDGLYLVPGVEQPPLDTSVASSAATGPATPSAGTESGARDYSAQTARKQSPSAGLG